MRSKSILLIILSFSLGFGICFLIQHSSNTTKDEVISEIKNQKNETEDCPSHAYEYVDLGLPSGTMWAKYNVGAASEAETGLYFCWGEIKGHSLSSVLNDFQSNNYSYNKGNANLKIEQDAVNAYMGDSWRLPTKADFEEMLAGCDASWVSSYNGSNVAGEVFTSKYNGNKIFFPAGGACPPGFVFGISTIGSYWTSNFATPSKFNPPIPDIQRAFILFFDEEGLHIEPYTRDGACPVRGVFIK